MSNLVVALAACAVAVVAVIIVSCIITRNTKLPSPPPPLRPLQLQAPVYRTKDRPIWTWTPILTALPMPKLEEAYISTTSGFQKLLESVISVRLSLNPIFNSAKESVYRSGIVFNQLEHFKLRIYKSDWSKLLIWLLRNSPKLRVLNLCVDWSLESDEYEPVKWKNSVPECLLRSLETFEFKDCMGTQEERDFLSFIFKHARCLKSTSIIHHVPS